MRSCTSVHLAFQLFSCSRHSTLLWESVPLSIWLWNVLRYIHLVEVNLKESVCMYFTAPVYYCIPVAPEYSLPDTPCCVHLAESKPGPHLQNTPLWQYKLSQKQWVPVSPLLSEFVPAAQTFTETLCSWLHFSLKVCSQPVAVNNSCTVFLSSCREGAFTELVVAMENPVSYFPYLWKMSQLFLVGVVILISSCTLIYFQAYEIKASPLQYLSPSENIGSLGLLLLPK